LIFVSVANGDKQHSPARIAGLEAVNDTRSLKVSNKQAVNCSSPTATEYFLDDLPSDSRWAMLLVIFDDQHQNCVWCEIKNKRKLCDFKSRVKEGKFRR